MTLYPVVKYLGPWDNGNFLSLRVILKFALLMSDDNFHSKYHSKYKSVDYLLKMRPF